MRSWILGLFSTWQFEASAKPVTFWSHHYTLHTKKSYLLRLVSSRSQMASMWHVYPHPSNLGPHQFSSVTQSCPTFCDPMVYSMPDFSVHHQLPEFIQTRWCHATISSSVVPYSSCPQSFPASGSFQMSQLFAAGGQSIRASASTSVLPMNTQVWFPLGWTGWISFQSKGLSRVFSNTTVQKHQFFCTQLSSESNSLIHTWLLEKP